MTGGKEVRLRRGKERQGEKGKVREREGAV